MSSPPLRIIERRVSTDIRHAEASDVRCLNPTAGTRGEDGMPAHKHGLQSGHRRASRSKHPRLPLPTAGREKTIEERQKGSDTFGPGSGSHQIFRGRHGRRIAGLILVACRQSASGGPGHRANVP